MAKYVTVKVSLEKLDTDIAEEAIKMTKDEFSYLEQTSEWLSERKVTFKKDF